MEFREFSNPEEADYDISSSLEEEEVNTEETNPYLMQLIDLIGILEDFTEEDLQNMYGITENEYFHPTAETISKVSQRINAEEHIKQR